MKKKSNKFLAVALSAAMIAGNTTMAFADKGTTGSGEIQWVEVGDVFSVVLPADNATTFNYLLDPEGLIQKTNADRYGNKDFEPDKHVYFANVSGSYDYSSVSDKLRVVNMSTRDVDLTLDIKIEEADGVVMAATASDLVGTSKTENLFMGIQYDVTNSDLTSTSSDWKAITTEGIKITESIPVSEDAYYVSWNPTKQYYEKIATAYNADYYGVFEFNLVGDCKTDTSAALTALTALEENAPKIDVTWAVEDFTVPAISGNAPSIATTTNKMNTTTLIIPVDLGTDDAAATKVTSIYWVEGNTELLGNTSMAASFDSSAKTVRFGGKAQTAMKNNGGGTVKVTFDDIKNTVIILTLTK